MSGVEIDIFSPPWWYNAGAATACIIGASSAAGLTMGLVSIELASLQQIMVTEMEDCDTDEERKELKKMKQYAAKIAPLKKDHHLLLVTLLLLNASVNEALPIFLDNIVPSWLAIVLSVSLVLLFGEILPSAVFTGPKQLQISSSFTPFVWTLIFAFYPISYPIAKALDCFLGSEHHGRHGRAELKGLLRKQASDIVERKHNAKEAIMDYGIGEEQIQIMQSALDLKKNTLKEILTPLDEVYMLPAEGTLDTETMVSIMHSGHSRIPVYSKTKHNICGMILVKRLILLNPDEPKPIRAVCSRKPLVLHADDSLLDALAKFAKGCHIAIIVNDVAAVKRAFSEGKEIPCNVHMMGVVTLEDIIECIIQADIVDESDYTGSGNHHRYNSKGKSRLKAMAAAMVHEMRRKKKAQANDENSINSVNKESLVTPLLSSRKDNSDSFV